MSRLLGVLAVLFPLIAAADDPPRPNPDDPVDYVAWINAEYGRQVKDNAADDYQAAFAAFVANDAALEVVTKRAADEWSEQDKTLLKSWIDQNEACLDKYVAATNKSRCYFIFEAPESGTMVGVMLPSLRPFRDIAKLLRARASLRIGAGDAAEAMDDICALLVAGRHMRAQPMLIQYLVGVAVSATAYDAALELPGAAVGSADYEMLLRTLRRADRKPRPATKQLECEKLTFWDAAQHWGRDQNGDGKLEQWVVPAGIMGDASTTLAISPPGALDDVLAEADHLYGAGQTVFEQEYGEARRLAAKIESDIQARRAKVPLLAALGPSLGRVDQLYRKLVARRAGARVVLRMHAFKAEHGRWPSDLKEATQGEAPSIRKDPFSGMDLVYCLKGGEPLLYSVGFDGKDDGGKQPPDGKHWGETGDAVFWPPQQR
ncbi:MAG: hypothetical protein KKB50_20420 [Planctomycetes bacterium]|nr:hypothetical protein [Planctomycetota bacterium]